MNNTDTETLNPLQIFRCLIKYRNLTLQLVKREVVGRYKGSLFGLAWSFFNPLIMLALYTIVFNTIFQSRWSTGSQSKTEFALVLFIGMIIHGVIAETLGRTPSLILYNVSYVKKIVFPLEILPWVMMGSTLFHAIVSLCVWVLFYLLANQSIQWTIVFLPLLIFPLVMFSMGLAWMLSSLGVYLRDVAQITAVISSILLFVSPVFYPVSRIPERFLTLFYLNPLTFIIEQARDVMMWGKMPNFHGIGILLITSLCAAWIGFIWFQKTRKGFADVL